ncbi:MAG TPA: non-canonical purine NTP pyrophosphatase, partial [Gaiellaceae bacterium]|nr:non-canonical purine NTP pyrophosphatase [Gaiellaceae bacterium]
EDSWIEVDALGGRPGIQSARYAPEGAPAIARLLAELDGVAERGARYVSELVALAPDGVEHRGTGTLSGRIAEAPRGSEGFGYDPVFVPEGAERTVAELGDDWKERNSHRARAARALLAALAGALLLAGCGGSSPPSVQRTFARFLAGPDGAAWAARFPHHPGSRPCTTRDPLVKKVVAATCSTALSVETREVLATFTVSWSHGSRVRAWLVFLRSDGRIASISREGSSK